MRTFMLILLSTILVMGVAVWYGTDRWQSRARAIHAALERSRSPIGAPAYHGSELHGLPAPVQRYLRAALPDGQAMITGLTVDHAGTFNMSGTSQQWKSFTSHQRTIIAPPGFNWEGRIAFMPGINVRVRDSYVDGEGALNASLFGLVALASLGGTPEMAQGELMRFLAEAAWYPTALLPRRGVTWEAVDDRSAKATLRDGATTATLLFRFGSDDLIESVQLRPVSAPSERT